MSETVSTKDSATPTKRIEARYHARHRMQFHNLAALAARVEQVRAADPEALAGSREGPGVAPSFPSLP